MWFNKQKEIPDVDLWQYRLVQVLYDNGTHLYEVECNYGKKDKWVRDSAMTSITDKLSTLEQKRKLIEDLNKPLPKVVEKIVVE